MVLEVIQSTYPVLCTPSQKDIAFVLHKDAFYSREAYGDTLTCTIFHSVCVISPRLVLLMRNEHLPELTDAKKETVQNKKKLELQNMTRDHLARKHVMSILEDIKVFIPRYHYTRKKHGQLVFPNQDDVENDNNTFVPDHET